MAGLDRACVRRKWWLEDRTDFVPMIGMIIIDMTMAMSTMVIITMAAMEIAMVVVIVTPQLSSFAFTPFERLSWGGGEFVDALDMPP